MLVTAAALAAAFAAGAPASSSAACPAGAQCAALTVPLDHRGATPGTLSIAYARMPATGTRTGTLVLLAGGPGQAAIPLARGISRLLAPLRSRYDLVFLDERGTGASGAVGCAPIATAEDVPACAAKLGSARPFMTTTQSAMDLESLRVALGADALTLLGVSYGAKLAGEYARRYSATTAALVLDSPASVDGLDGVERLPVLGAPRVLSEVCFPGPCARTVGDPAKALTAAAHRLQRGALKGPFVAAGGKVRSERVTESLLFNALTASDVSPGVRALLPAAIASLAAGDAAPMLHLVALTGDEGGDDGVNVARLLATTCVEGHLPWAPDSPVESRKAALAAYVTGLGPGPFAPFRPATVLDNSAAGLCAAWPPTPAPEGVASAGPDVPVLVLSGREDLRTPTEDARRTAAEYPHAQLLSVPGVGHSVLTSEPTPCALDGTVAFLAGQAVEPCSQREDGRARATLPVATPFIPASISALRPTKVGGLPGRTLTAVGLTISGVVSDAVLTLTRAKSQRIPGLRGGFAVRTGKSLTFFGMEWIRGVRITGTLDGSSRGTLAVSGPAAAPGTLTFAGRRITGTLGGRAIE